MNMQQQTYTITRADGTVIRRGVTDVLRHGESVQVSAQMMDSRGGTDEAAMHRRIVVDKLGEDAVAGKSAEQIEGIFDVIKCVTIQPAIDQAVKRSAHDEYTQRLSDGWQQTATVERPTGRDREIAAEAAKLERTGWFGSDEARRRAEIAVSWMGPTR